MNKNSTKSSHINHAIELSLAAGNEVKEVSYGWSRVSCVVFFCEKMSWDLRVKIEREEPGLRYFSTEPTPHNKADEGFICDQFSVAISYPR